MVRAKATELDSAPSDAAAEHSAETRYAGRLGKHALVYGVANFMTVLSGLVGVAVYTRFLNPTEYGKIAVLMTTASAVTVGVNLCSLQGTMRRVYGTGGDDEAGDDEIDEQATAGDPRLAFTTGLVLTASIGTAIMLVAFVFRNDLSRLFFGTTGDSDLLLLTVGAGASAGVMRLAVYFLRMQLRSVAYLAVYSIFALGSTLLTIFLLAEGVGISAILIGAIVGSATSGALAVFLLRRDVRAAVSLSEAKTIMRSGAGYLPIIISFQVLQLADIYLVAGIAGFDSAGLYSVAKKVAQPVSYGTSVFQQAWGPMAHDLTGEAVYRKDDDLTITAKLVTYYAVFVIALILGISIFAHQLVRLASPEYTGASILIPMAALSIAGHGAFVLVYRTSRLPTKWRWLQVLSSVAAVIFLGVGTVLIISFGAIGAPIAAACAWGIATMAMVFISQSNAQKVPFERLKLFEAASIAGAVWVVGYYAVPNDPLGIIAKGGLFALWAVLVVALRVVPFDALRTLLGFVRYSSDAESKRKLRARAASLGGRDASFVEEVLQEKLPIDEVAERHDLPEDEVLASTVQALRRAATGGDPQPKDTELGRVILIPRPAAEERSLLSQLVLEGVDPIDTDLIVRTATAARTARGHGPVAGLTLRIARLRRRRE